MTKQINHEIEKGQMWVCKKCSSPIMAVKPPESCPSCGYGKQ